ncbi:MAG: sensor histidine kinase [Emergencia sp.]
MKNKVKHNPFLYTAAILIILFTLLIGLSIGMFYYAFSITEPEGFSLASWPKRFTDNFATWIEYKNGIVSIESKGMQYLNEYGVWLQVLDEAGQEVFSYQKPEQYPNNYSISEFVILSESKYENGNTVFVNSVELSNETLNYVIGFPYAIGKHMLYYNGENVARLSPFVRKLIIFAACAVIFGTFIYTFWISRKLSAIINGINHVILRTYQPMKENGIFGVVYAAINRMDKDIRRSAEIQEETDRTRKEWISNITHDLKTPLSPIRGYAELLTDDCLEKQKIRDYGAIILKNANHIDKLINDLKLTYQLEAGAIPYTPQRIRIVRFLKELVIDVANDPAFSGRSLEFESEVSEVITIYDPALIRRAIQNIVLNALVHNSKDTKIKVAIKSVSEYRLCISICDNGKGMSVTEISRLWNRYYRGTNTEEETAGSGLGLAIAKQIITLHGGDITVHSTLGKGTEFVITLPLEKEQTN